jgi:hypothetical protein
MFMYGRMCTRRVCSCGTSWDSCYFSPSGCACSSSSAQHHQRSALPLLRICICMCMCVHTLYVHSGLPGAVLFFAVVSVCSSSSAQTSPPKGTAPGKDPPQLIHMCACAYTYIYIYIYIYIDVYIYIYTETERCSAPFVLLYIYKYITVYI